MKVQIEIEIPDGHEIVDVCDVSKHFGGRPACFVNTVPAKPFLINGVPSEWPEWLTCDYVAKDKDGSPYGYIGEPKIRDSSWGDARKHFPLFGLIAIDIPGDWTQSKRENPRRKK